MKTVWLKIKAAGAWLRKILEDADGNPSSKRIMSYILFGVGIRVIGMEGVELGSVITIFSAALALQGVTAWQR